MKCYKGSLVISNGGQSPMTLNVVDVSAKNKIYERCAFICYMSRYINKLTDAVTRRIILTAQLLEGTLAADRQKLKITSLFFFIFLYQKKFEAQTIGLQLFSS